MMDERQADNYREQMIADKFYMKNGRCCAGCDHWRHIGELIGECKNSKILPSSERVSLLNIKSCTVDIGAGNAITRRDYVCGQFKDSFNWKLLPLMYLKQIGYENRKENDQ